MAPSLPLKCSLEVADALAAGQPVVALESTIIAHGLPHPENATDPELGGSDGYGLFQSIVEHLS